VLAYASCLWGVYDIYDLTVYCQPPAGKISRSEVRCELPEAKRRAEFTPNETTQKFYIAKEDGDLNSKVVPIFVTSPGKGVGQASMTLDIPKNNTC